MTPSRWKTDYQDNEGREYGAADAQDGQKQPVNPAVDQVQSGGSPPATLAAIAPSEMTWLESVPVAARATT
jgi:hypothetical protein